MRRVSALLLAACWTGSAQPEQPVAGPPAVLARHLEVRLQRTPCFGSCPTFTVVIHGNGRVEWDGKQYVAEVGHRARQIGAHAIDQLDKTIDRLRFFERDDYGELPVKANCTTTGSSTSCSFESSLTICSDTSHSIITVIRDGKVHKIDNAHCSERAALDELEDEIEHIARLDEWIGS